MDIIFAAVPGVNKLFFFKLTLEISMQKLSLSTLVQ